MLHDYNGHDVETCSQGREIAFIGDSNIRQIFWATARKLDYLNAVREQRLAESNKHADLGFPPGAEVLKFIWDPYLNGSSLQQELLRRHDDTVRARNGRLVLLIGGGLWHARYLHNPGKHFRAAIAHITSYMDLSGALDMATQPGSGSEGVGDQVFFAPVQMPYFDLLEPDRAAALTPNRIREMNDCLEQLYGGKGLHVLWSYLHTTSQGRAAFRNDGLHVTDSVADTQADILLNIRCNDKAVRTHKYPYDRTCCMSYTPYTPVQFVGLFVGICIALGTLWLRIKSVTFDRKRGLSVLMALYTLTIALFYCFCADRTHVFNKVTKHYTAPDFSILCYIILALGAISIRSSIRRFEPSREPERTSASTCSQFDESFLSRDQTEEWKGWMQFVVLVYHYTGASQQPEIYKFVRLLVASYLFLTGYGHAAFFYEKQNYSLKRVAMVLVRLNLLSCALPYTMRTEYLFYYFAPLSSFWFLVVYLTMRFCQSRNAQLGFLVAKLVVSAVLVVSFTKTPGILEAIFKMLQVTCNIHWNLKEWRFRLELDQYVVFVGMLAAIAYARISAILATPAASDDVPQRLVRRYFLLTRSIVTAVSLLTMPAYWFLTNRLADKYAYNAWHPYISPLPILAFVVLRNSHAQLRRHHTVIYAWLGRCSLETFTLQFHIWLAADTKGLLSTGLFRDRGEGFLSGRGCDFVLLTPLFLWISCKVATATARITTSLVDVDTAKDALPIHKAVQPGNSNKIAPHKHRSDTPPARRDSLLPTRENHDTLSINAFGMRQLRICKAPEFVMRAVGQRWRTDLRFRLLVLGLGMWVLNMISTRPGAD
ncbi:hypothetical protein LTR04_000497 [Oleoguttula sp. CCFEE 6159]|nr:hypothetical protein LTR04_000497 [Oleoguttula sp. CCFEE 6159]